MNKVVILSGGKLIGPFADQGVAQQYVETHTLGNKTEFYSIWNPAEGTAETAHECGALLPSIDEATEAPRRRGTAGA